MAGAAVNVTGLRELRRALKSVDASILPELREGLKDAADVVVLDVKRAIPQRSGRAAGSVRSTAAGNTVYVKGGGAAVPYYGWLEFGGTLPPVRPRNKKALSWGGIAHPVARTTAPRRRRVVTDGRYIRPAVARNEPLIVTRVTRAFDAARQRAGL